jgi:hypothetical protein
MKARELIEGASYGPDALKIVAQAFDDAWTSIAGNFGGNALAVEAVRLKLANFILDEAPAHRGDASGLKDAALRAMATDYRKRGERPLPQTD